MKVSIALCTYNGERYLEEQLNSYLDQTFQPYEMVACDDKSSDKTLGILENFKMQNIIPVHIYHNEKQLGVIKNFEKAISLCSGDLIALSDQDDVWLPNKLEILVNEFNKVKNKDINVIFSDLALVDSDLKPLGQTMWENRGFDQKQQQECDDGGYFRLMKSRGNMVTGAGMIFRKSFIHKVIPFENKGNVWFHDGQIAMVAARDNELMHLNSKLVLYRQHTGQAIGTRPLIISDKLSVKLKFLIEIKKSNLSFFDKINAWEKGERERMVNEISHIERRVDILGKPVLKRIFPVFKEIFTLNYLRYYRRFFLKNAISDFLKN